MSDAGGEHTLINWRNGTDDGWGTIADVERTLRLFTCSIRTQKIEKFDAKA